MSGMDDEQASDPEPPLTPFTMGETPEPPVTLIPMGETPEPPVTLIPMGETPKPPVTLIPMGETPKPPVTPFDAPGRGNALLIGVTLTNAGVIAYAFDPARAGQSAVLGALAVFYGLLATLALHRLYRRGELVRRFLPARGDITLAAATAGVLYGGAHIAASLLAAHGSPRELWVMRLYLQLGDPDAPGRSLVGIAVFGVAALEEIVWRGLVMPSIQDVAGPWRAVALSTALYAVAHLPTLVFLRAPGAGYNPLVLLAALGCGLVWGLLVLRTGRLLPALLAHALFSWSIIEFPLWQLRS
jgi:membrane protease YdiL (CAAX protease family)